MPKTISTADKLRDFLRNRPADWSGLSSKERKEKAIAATGIKASYLNVLVSNNQQYKALFGVQSRDARGKARKGRTVMASRGPGRPRRVTAGDDPVSAILSTADGLELSQLVTVAKGILKRIRAKMADVNRQVDELKKL